MAWNNAGLALFRLKRYDEARSTFEKAACLQPQNALFWNNLAAVHLEQDHPQQAERILQEEALPRNPDHPLAHLNLGAVYLRLDRPDLAAQHLRTALRLSPPGQTAKARTLFAQTQEPARWLRLGDLLLGRDDPEDALHAFDRADTLGAPPADIAVGKSAAFIHQHAWSRAEAVLQAVLPNAPNDARLHTNMGLVARERGDIQAARTHFRRALSLSPDWDLPRRHLDALK